MLKSFRTVCPDVGITKIHELAPRTDALNPKTPPPPLLRRAIACSNVPGVCTRAANFKVLGVASSCGGALIPGRVTETTEEFCAASLTPTPTGYVPAATL